MKSLYLESIHRSLRSKHQKSLFAEKSFGQVLDEVLLQPEQKALERGSPMSQQPHYPKPNIVGLVKMAMLTG